MKKLWENIWFRFFVTIGFFALFLWACFELRSILIPLAMAFIVAYIFDPVVDVFERKKISRTITIAALLTLLVAIFAGLMLIIIPRLVRESADLLQAFQKNLPAIQAKIESLATEFGNSDLAERLTEDIEAALGSLQNHVPKILQSMERVFTRVVSSTFGFIGAIANFVLFAVVTVYLLKDFDTITARAKELIPPTNKDSILGILQKIDANLKSFFRGQIIVCTVLAVIYAIGLSIVGVPFALLLALIGGYGQIVPYMGTALGLLPAVVLAFVEYGDIWHPLGAIAAFAVGQSLEGFVITPKIMGETVGLHPVVIILSILVFGNLLGFLGILIAVPMAAVLKVLLTEALEQYKKSSFFTGPET